MDEYVAIVDAIVDAIFLKKHIFFCFSHFFLFVSSKSHFWDSLRSHTLFQKSIMFVVKSKTEKGEDKKKQVAKRALLFTGVVVILRATPFILSKLTEQ